MPILPCLPRYRSHFLVTHLEVKRQKCPSQYSSLREMNSFRCFFPPLGQILQVPSKQEGGEGKMSHPMCHERELQLPKEEGTERECYFPNISFSKMAELQWLPVNPSKQQHNRSSTDIREFSLFCWQLEANENRDHSTNSYATFKHSVSYALIQQSPWTSSLKS